MPEDTLPPQPPPSADAAAGRKRRGRIAAWLIGAPALLIAVLLLAAISALQTDRGSQLLWRAGVWAMQGKLGGEYAGGSVAQGVHLRKVFYHDAGTQLDIDRLDGSWRFAVGARKLSVAYLRIGNVDLTLQPTPSKPTVLPQDLRLPIAIDLQQLTLQSLRIEQGTSINEIGNLALHGSSDGVQHSVSVDSLHTDYGDLNARLALSGRRPFAVDGGVDLSGAYGQEKYSVNAKLSGSLQALGVALNADGDKLKGAAQIDAAPFDKVPLHRAQISIDHINPKAFSPGAPEADIALRADLKPSTQNGAAPATDAPFSVTGSVDASNALPGRIDQNRLPVQTIHADVRLDAASQQLKKLTIALTGGASVSGQGVYRIGDTPAANSGNVDLNVAALNLHALHNALRPTRLGGPLSIKLQGDTQQIALTQSDPAIGLSAQLDLLIDKEKLQIRQAELSEGRARLTFTGALAHTGDMAYSAKGALRQFDPALLTGKRRSGPRNASINMDFDIAGALAAKPQPRLKLRFGLRDSIYDQLPMTGGGNIDMLGARLLAGDVSLLIAGNQLQAKGSFGAPTDSLNLHIDAPQLQRLGYGLSGLLKVDGQLGGTLQRPSVRASYQANQLAFGAYRLDRLDGNADLQGDWRNPAAAGNRLDLRIAARGYRSPGVLLNTLNANLAGAFADHKLQLDAQGALHGKALALKLAAHGKLLPDKGQYGWTGSIDKLDNTGVPRIALQRPLSVDAGADHLILGSTRLSVADAVIDLQNFSYRPTGIRTQGNIQALNISTVLDLLREFDIAVPPLKTDLVLDSRWDLTLADTASGYLDIERKSGDAIVSAGGIDVPLGLNTLKLRADLQGRAVNLTASVQAARIGSIDGKGSLTLIKEGNLLTLTPDSALSAQARIAVPTLAPVSALLGPKIAFRGSLGAQFSARGTLGQPKLSGAINGDGLSLTLYDQGIQLQNGTVRVVMNENVIDLQRFEFYGGKGTLRASGQVQLGKANPDLNAKLIADKLELFASPDRRLMLSGQAAIASLADQLRIDGQFKVDHALFDLPPSSAPTLGDDVVIVRNNGKSAAGAQATSQQKLASASEKPAGRFSPTIAATVDLGDDFRFRGSGADLRLRGTLDLKSEPYAPLRATGTIRVADGTYEAFGVKLAIERGIINFQGPLDNPNINLLAMRRNQDIPAGVEVTGNANAPRVRLVSEPNVSEEEKLSWIMFGQGSSSGLGQRTASSEALAFVGNLGGKKIARDIGLDQFSIGSSESGITGVAGDQFVNLGKAISQKFMLGYEQSLTGAESVAKLTYQLSRNWQILMRGGTINSLNLLFNRRYD